MLKNTTAEGEQLDYAFQTQFYERRIETLLEWQWAEFAVNGQVTARNYVSSVSFE